MIAYAGRPDLAGALAAARRLAGGLDTRLLYHDERHTFEEVLPSALDLADDMGVSGSDRVLIETATAFHDLGFLQTRAGHELAAIDLTRQLLPAFGYSGEEVDKVAGMILATRLPQRPTTPLEQIVADADLSVLAAPDFMRRNEHLRLELSAYGRSMPKGPWLLQQQRFLLKHRDHTPAARRRYCSARIRNAGQLGARRVAM